MDATGRIRGMTRGKEGKEGIVYAFRKGDGGERVGHWPLTGPPSRRDRSSLQLTPDLGELQVFLDFRRFQNELQTSNRDEFVLRFGWLSVCSRNFVMKFIIDFFFFCFLHNKSISFLGFKRESVIIIYWCYSLYFVSSTRLSLHRRSLLIIKKAVVCDLHSCHRETNPINRRLNWRPRSYATDMKRYSYYITFKSRANQVTFFISFHRWKKIPIFEIVDLWIQLWSYKLCKVTFEEGPDLLFLLRLRGPRVGG